MKAKRNDFEIFWKVNIKMSTEEIATSLMFSSPSKKDLENVTNTRKEEDSTTNTMPSGGTIKGRRTMGRRHLWE